MDEQYNDLKQELKELRNDFHTLDKSVVELTSTINQQHKNMEQLLRDDIRTNAEKHKEYDDRLDKIDKDVAEIKAENKSKHRNNNILLGVGTIVATVGAVIIGILIDKFLLGG